MLKLPQKHTDDDKANAIIAWYLNRNILGLVRNEILDYESSRGKEAEEDDSDFCNAVRRFFPKRCPAEKMGSAFLGLRALLESEYEFVPELVMEYVMYSLIEARIETADGLGIRTLDPVPFQRDYLIEIFKKENPGMPEAYDDAGDIFFTWQEKLEQIEDLHNYENVYFWDFDFLQLEMYTEEQLLASPASKYLGIDNIGSPDRKFVIPPEWME